MIQREGYLLVDHRASPGLPEDMARRMGGKSGSNVIEQATLTCCHCRAVVLKNPFRQRERSNCAQCGFRYLCDLCAGKTREAGYVHMSCEAIVEKALKGG